MCFFCQSSAFTEAISTRFLNATPTIQTDLSFYSPALAFSHVPFNQTLRYGKVEGLRYTYTLVSSETMSSPDRSGA